jgi:NAD(P)H-dependent flavin oxidoreductase YrpB (nitropropane dioxygenase family)
MRTPLTEQFGIETPIFAFSYMPEVVAAVTNAGGMGVLGAVRFSTDELAEALDFIDSQVHGRPYGVDIVMPSKTVAQAGLDEATLYKTLQDMIPQEHRDFAEKVLADHGIPPLPDGEEEPRDLLGWTDTTARPQVDLALGHNISLLANALGTPPEDIVQQAHDAGVQVAALVGRTDQALKQREIGVDIIVAQGTEAGGHTGEVATMVLTPEVVDAVSPAPVLAAGGIASGRQVAAALALGAQGVWTGSVWLNTVEAGQPQALYDKFHRSQATDAVRSRAYTGKPARQLRTPWTDAWDAADTPEPLGMPLQYMLNGPAQHRIRLSGNEEMLGIPIGQVVGAMRETHTVRQVMDALREGYAAAVASLPQAAPAVQA